MASNLADITYQLNYDRGSVRVPRSMSIGKLRNKIMRANPGWFKDTDASRVQLLQPKTIDGCLQLDTIRLIKDYFSDEQTQNHVEIIISNHPICRKKILTEMFQVSKLNKYDPEYNRLMKNYWLDNESKLEPVKKFTRLTIRKYPPMTTIDDNKANTIFVRPCYIVLYNLLFRYVEQNDYAMDIVITGSPGIGKSRFYVYCLYCLCSSNKLENKIIIANCEAQYELYEEGYFYALSEAEVREMKEDPTVVRLVDAKSSMLLGWRGISILFASHAAPEYGEFAKSRNDKKHVMPVWALEELTLAISVCEIHMEDQFKTVQERYDIFGGIPRYVFATYSRYENLIQKALGSENLLKICNYVSGRTPVDERRYSHMLLHMIPCNIPKKKDDLKNDNLFLESHLEFASNKLQDTIFKRLVDVSHAKLNEFVVATAADRGPASSFRGFLFEILGHRNFINNAVEHTLTGHALCEENNTFTLTVPARMEVIWFGKSQETPLFSNENAAYCRPISKTYPGVDAIYWNGEILYLLQMTISKRHGIKQDSFCKALEQLKCTELSLAFVFVVPEDLVANYPRQNYLRKDGTVAQNIRQLVNNLEQYVVGVSFPCLL